MIKSQPFKAETRDVERRLLEEAERFGQLVRARGTPVKTATARSLEHMQSQPLEKLEGVVTHFKSYTDLVLSAVTDDPEALSDDVRLLRRIVDKLRLIVSDEIYDKIDRNDIVEIYNKDFIQVYRGLDFMGLSNYSLVEILTYEFYELYERSISINETLFENAQLIQNSGKMNGLRYSNIPKHILRERFSEPQGVFECEFLYCYPVFRWPREFYGFLMWSRIVPYHELSASGPELRFL